MLVVGIEAMGCHGHLGGLGGGEFMKVSIRSISSFSRRCPIFAKTIKQKRTFFFLQVFCFFVQFAGGVGIFSDFAFVLLTFLFHILVFLSASSTITTTTASSSTWLFLRLSAWSFGYCGVCL
jgi:hypothetical protein